MFRLTKREWENLKSQFVISSWGSRRVLPFVFTEHGVTMLYLVFLIVSVLSKLIYKSSKLLLLCVVMRWFKSRKNITRRIGILENALLQYMDRNDKRANEIVETINDMLSGGDNEDTQQIGFVK